MLDEINVAMRYDYLNVADMVTEMVEVKHPFKAGIKAQRGVDF